MSYCSNLSFLYFIYIEYVYKIVVSDEKLPCLLVNMIYL